MWSWEKYELGYSAAEAFSGGVCAAAIPILWAFSALTAITLFRVTAYPDMRASQRWRADV